ncbi:hypothetical protein ABVT39_013336 [Epinephelus coioides]
MLNMKDHNKLNKSKEKKQDKLRQRTWKLRKIPLRRPKSDKDNQQNWITNTSAI